MEAKQLFRLIVILGAGESGVGAAILAKKLGFSVFVSDFGVINSSAKAELNENEIQFEEGKHTKEKMVAAHKIVKSPGIPDTSPIITTLKKNGLEVISEIEFAYQNRNKNCKIIGVTGSNGKTTTTNLIFHFLKAARFDVAKVGNIGVSFCRQIAETPKDYYVVEISSFQLDNIVDFKSDIAILLNISPDHLDRYNYSLEEYGKSKFRIIENLTIDDSFIYWKEDGLIHKFLSTQPHKVKVYPYGKENFVNNEILMGNYATIDFREVPLMGMHNQFNLFAALKTCQLLGVKFKSIQTSLISFVNDPHRLELVSRKNNITFINDSKATNLEAVIYAFSGVDKPVIWIVGGVDKGNDYATISRIIQEKVSVIIALGLDNSKIINAFKTKIHTIVDVDNMKMAIENAIKLATPGTSVLLSPACASFDLFKNYKDRGNQFRTEVLKLV